MGIIVVPGIILAIIAEVKVKNTFNKYSTAFGYSPSNNLGFNKYSNCPSTW